MNAIDPGEDQRIEPFAFDAFAQAHPHEAYASWPERFWEFFQRERPGISRAQMEQVLRETEAELN